MIVFLVGVRGTPVLNDEVPQGHRMMVIVCIPVQSSNLIRRPLNYLTYYHAVLKPFIILKNMGKRGRDHEKLGSTNK